MNQNGVQSNLKRIPFLVTWDVDPDRWATSEQRECALTKTLDLCEELGIRSTFFITANHAHEYPQITARMRGLGQEVGCHGLTHTDEEDYDRMPLDLQRDYLADATHKLEAVVEQRVGAFRSPRVKTSARTLQLLSDLGYRADSSICSQRMDVVSSNLIQPGWLIAPRNTYHPHAQNAYRRGSLPIWEVPVSAAVIPFISSSLKVLGLGPMKVLFRLLYAESRRTGKPVVYLAHPTEFLDLPGRRTKLTVADFSPARIRTHGILARNLLYRLSGSALWETTRALFSYVARFPGVVPMTVCEYIKSLEK